MQEVVIRPYKPSPQWIEKYCAALHTTYASKLRDVKPGDAARVMYALRRWNFTPPDLWTGTFLEAVSQVASKCCNAWSLT